MKMRKTSVMSLLLVPALLVGVGTAAAREIPAAPADYLSKSNPMAGKADAIAKGVKLYEKRCTKCHGPKGDGQGKSAKGLEPAVPSFADGYLAKRKDGQLFYVIEKGSANTDMDAFGPGTNFNMSEDDIWSVVAYMRSKFK